MMIYACSATCSCRTLWEPLASIKTSTTKVLPSAGQIWETVWHPAPPNLPESFRADLSPVGKDCYLFLPHGHSFFQDSGKNHNILFYRPVIVIISVFIFPLLFFCILQLIIFLHRIGQNSIRKIQSTVCMDTAA